MKSYNHLQLGWPFSIKRLSYKNWRNLFIYFYNFLGNLTKSPKITQNLISHINFCHNRKNANVRMTQIVLDYPKTINVWFLYKYWYFLRGNFCGRNDKKICWGILMHPGHMPLWSTYLNLMKYNPVFHSTIYKQKHHLVQSSFCYNLYPHRPKLKIWNVYPDARVT